MLSVAMVVAGEGILRIAHRHASSTERFEAARLTHAGLTRDIGLQSHFMIKHVIGESSRRNECFC